MASLRDGLGGEEISPSGVEVSGTNMVYVHPYFLGSVTTEEKFVNPEGELQSVAAGSTYGAIVQCGSATLSSNEVSVLFKTAYTGAPIVTVSNLDNVGSQTVWVGSTISATGFTAVGTASDDELSWIAVGI